jgi:hypothetical protein
MPRLFAIAVALALFVGENATTQSQTPSARQGLEGVWDFSMLTPVQRPPEFADTPFITPIAAAAWARRLRTQAENNREPTGIDRDIWFERGQFATLHGRVPTSLIIDPPDGRMPALTPERQRRIGERRLLDVRADGPEDRSLNERCLRAVSGPPYLPSSDANTLRIVQSSTVIALTNEKFHDTRLVAVGRREHLPSTLRSWTGDAIGRWDDQTLVIDTTNFSPNIGLTGNYDGNLHLVERLMRIDPDTLLYEAMIDDASAFVRPWKIAVPMRQVNVPLYEFACHEGNYSMANILSGSRADEQSIADTAKSGRNPGQ